MAASVQILGIDPGSRCTGYALTSFEGREVVDLVVGTWRVAASKDRAVSLGALAEEFDRWIAQHTPAVAVVEALFHHKNARSLIVLSEARGALLSVLGRRGVPVREYPPATIKKTICGFGAADKEQVRRALIRTVPGLRRFHLEEISTDASDALAMAVCHRIQARHEQLADRSLR